MNRAPGTPGTIIEGLTFMSLESRGKEWNDENKFEKITFWAITSNLNKL